jgi:hypothetical protein
MNAQKQLRLFKPAVLIRDTPLGKVRRPAPAVTYSTTPAGTIRSWSPVLLRLSGERPDLPPASRPERPICSQALLCGDYSRCVPTRSRRPEHGAKIMENMAKTI